MHVRFWGAARAVTGSMHLLEVGGRRVLVDCGMIQGKRKQAYELNRHLPFDAGSVDAVLLTHAHADHSGNLPGLARQGFRGRIYCTPATRDLCAWTLRDAAHIQEADVAYVNERRQRRGEAPFQPLYTMKDALDALELFVSVGYGLPFPVVPGITAEFRDAGHILGSANVTVDMTDGARSARVLFSGDVGRGGLAIVGDPTIAEGADILVLESTYGDRIHESSGEALSTLRLAVRETCVERRAKLIIPSFAMGRTQEVIYRLNTMWAAGELPHVDVYVDSPLAVNLTEVFRLHPECYDAEMQQVMARDPDGDPLGFGGLTYVRSVERSKELNKLAGPAIIISASGMCENGRILHHLANHIGSAANAVMFVGFQAEDTLGRRIQQGVTPVRIFGDEYTVRARVYSVEGYSAHADREELAGWALRVKNAGQLRQVCLVHGEEPALRGLKERLAAAGFENVSVPERGAILEL